MVILKKKRSVGMLWQDFFSNTSEWWDHRPGKINPKFPDFKHKQTRESLWVVDPRNPPWVQAELAAILPGTLQSNAFAWAQRLKRLASTRQYRKVMEIFQQMQHEKIHPDSWTFLPVLNACAGLGALEEGRCVHKQIIQVGCESEIHVATCLVDMYAKCGSIDDAWIVFKEMRDRDVVTWSAMIGGYVKSGQGLKAIELFRRMKQEGVDPDAVIFVGVLNACASVGALEEGRHVHMHTIQRGFESDGKVANCLVDMYAKCGSIENAWSVFKKMRERDVVTWNAMIGGHVMSGQPGHVVKAMELFQQMRQEGVHPDCVTWNTMIVGYVKSGQGLKALELFRKMQQEGLKPNAVIFAGVLNACASVAALEEGRFVHKQLIQGGCESDVYVSTCLVDMYAKCGRIDDAWSVFNRMQVHNVVAWNVMIGGYVKSGQGLKAIQLFRRMQQDCVEPDSITFVGVLSGCAGVAALEEGRYVHADIIRRGCMADIKVANCLIDMYAKCDDVEDAWSVFNNLRERNVVTWNAMIGGYVRSRQGLKAMELFGKMRQEGVDPDAVTFVAVLNACVSEAALDEGRRVHRQILQAGCEADVYVANCLVDMYAKCGSIGDAWIVFSKMQKHNVVTWNAMIGGYVKSGQGVMAIDLFRDMLQEGVEPDRITFIAVLNACASVGALEEGRRVHRQMIQVGCEPDVCVSNCLVDMYAKCGSLDCALSVFNNMLERTVVTWNAMIVGYVKSGQGMKAMELFQDMQKEEVEPDTITFVGVLNACASVAALAEGRNIHRQIIQGGWDLDVYLGNCLVDMYAKCGSLEDSWTVFDKMLEHNVVTWNSMIWGYAMHGQAKKAIELFKQMSKESAEINQVTVTCLLAACGHGGLVKEGLRFFKYISSCANILPTMEHYVCMVDLLGRAGWLLEAEELIKRMPSKTDVCVWMSLLGSCRIHGNIEMAERVAKRCWELDPASASGYVLLSNIYAATWRSSAIEERSIESAKLHLNGGD